MVGPGRAAVNEEDRNARPVGTAAPMAVQDGLLADCRDLVCQRLSTLVDELFTKVEESLYDLADKATSRSLYTVYVGAVRSIRRHRDEIRDHFLSLLSTDPASGGRPTTDAEPLRLVSNDHELGESLALTNLVSKAETRYRAELGALRRYLPVRHGGERMEPAADAFGPRAICFAFHSALRRVEEVDPGVRLLVYKAFDQQVMDRLGAIYGGCLDLAHTEAAAPDPAPIIPMADGAQEAAIERAPVTPMPRAKAESPPGFDSLRRLLRRRQASPGAQATRVATDELLATLSRLQGTEPVPAELGQSVAKVRDRVRRELLVGSGGPGKRVLDSWDADTLDLVFLLFESILAAHELPDAVKALISRLQIPVLKVALADRRFFDEASHPARSLLNHLAEAAQGWSPQGGVVSSECYRRIAGIVQRIIDDFDLDLDLFRTLDAAVAADLAYKRRQADLRLARALEALATREHYRSAQQFVDRAIAARMHAQGRLPEPVTTLIQDGWRQVLVAAYQRVGEGGKDWRDALAVLDRLLWSVQPKVEQADRRELLRLIPGLLRTLREELTSLSYDPRRLARAFKELQALHIVALRGVPSETDRRGAPPASRPSFGVLDSEAIPPVPEAGLAGGLVAGGWIELRRAGATPRRMQLAGQSPAGVLLLVDPMGEQVLELEAAELADLIGEGSARVLADAEQAPLVDRALAALARSLAQA